jgi:hypothetical protein
MAHALSSDLRERDLYSTAIADMTPEADTLELSAVALPILHRTENTLTKKSVTFRFK